MALWIEKTCSLDSELNNKNDKNMRSYLNNSLNNPTKV